MRNAPPALKKPLQYVLVALGCLHLLGGPYSVIQIYAWANMLFSYSQETSFAEAVTDTFSGEKPCHLCEKIAEVKSSEPQDEPTPAPLRASDKLFQDLFAPTLVGLNDPSSAPLPETVFPAVADSVPLYPSGPLAPPPRC